MAQEKWLINGAKVIDVESVRKLKVGLIAGQVNIIGHDEPTASASRSTRPRAATCWSRSTATAWRSTTRASLGQLHRRVQVVPRQGQGGHHGDRAARASR